MDGRRRKTKEEEKHENQAQMQKENGVWKCVLRRKEKIEIEEREGWEKQRKRRNIFMKYHFRLL